MPRKRRPPETDRSHAMWNAHQLARTRWLRAWEQNMPLFEPPPIRDPEYRGHIINTRREGKHWVAHYRLPDHSTPEYNLPIPYPKVRSAGDFLPGPYTSQAKAIAAAKRAVDNNIIE